MTGRQLWRILKIMKFSGGADHPNGPFAKKVEAIVATIPRGRVMTYGQIAAICGNARAARIVGGIAHFGDPNLPWQRVVNKQGGLADGYPGGRYGHKEHLEAEGITVSGEEGNYHVNIGELLWEPNANKLFQADIL
jgi:methylated-DNA-protein-cysteine methyltransferase related protein